MKNSKPKEVFGCDDQGAFIICKPSKLFAVLLLIFFSLHFCRAQTAITKDAQGNYHATAQTKAKTPPTATKNTFTDSKGIVYPVFISPSGRHFVIRLSKKSGKNYNFYLD